MTARVGLSMARNATGGEKQKSRCVQQGDDPGNGVGGPCRREAKREFRCSILVRGVGRSVTCELLYWYLFLVCGVVTVFLCRWRGDVANEEDERMAG